VSLPLTGIRIVEMSHMIMGLSYGMVPAQLGAEVIKAPPQPGDIMMEKRCPRRLRGGAGDVRLLLSLDIQCVTQICECHKGMRVRWPRHEPM
jgi:hypothetical protein